MLPRLSNVYRLDTLATSRISRTLLTQSPRFVHSSAQRNVSLQHTPEVASQLLHPTSQTSSSPPPRATLARLPTSTVLRSYLITRMSSSPALLNMCFMFLRQMLMTKSYLLSAERNPLLAKLLKSTFYAQFCIGETKPEVKKNTTAIREQLGYDGIMLEYALESLGEGGVPTAAETAQEVEQWRKGMLDTIDIAKEGDFVGLK